MTDENGLDVGVDAGAERWDLRLYVAAQRPRSLTAFANLQRYCEQHLPGRYHIEVIDLLAHPQLAEGDRIVAVPTLVRRLPEPTGRIVGDLSDEERVLAAMGPRAAERATRASRDSGTEAPEPGAELERVQERLQEAEETLRAISLGEVDALIVQCPDGPRTYTLVPADPSSDLMERKDREREQADERLNRAVVEFAGTGIAVCDPAGRVLRANRMAAGLFGGEAVERTYDEALPTGPRFAEIIGPPLPDERRELEYTAPNGQRRHVVVSARPIGDALSPEEKRWVVVFTDVTHRKEIEQERLRLLVAEHEARASAEAANQAKTQFLAVMSHELRTPLSAVIGYADLLAEGVGGTPNATQSLYIGRIKMSAWHLLSLIEGILAFARVEAGKETTIIQATELGALAADAFSVVEGSGSTKGLNMRCQLEEGLAPAPTDPAKLRQILLNLLGNAIKFTEQGSVELVLERSGPYALFHIRDTGPGISPEDMSRIFEPFVQADQSATRRAGGTGLGLAIARNYADMIGAEVTVRSQPGAGSVFTVKVPLGD